MLHHIRHMIGTAVAVALGILPMELLRASMQVGAGSHTLGAHSQLSLHPSQQRHS